MVDLLGAKYLQRHTAEGWQWLFAVGTSPGFVFKALNSFVAAALCKSI